MRARSTTSFAPHLQSTNLGFLAQNTLSAPTTLPSLPPNKTAAAAALAAAPRAEAAGLPRRALLARHRAHKANLEVKSMSFVEGRDPLKKQSIYAQAREVRREECGALLFCAPLCVRGGGGEGQGRVGVLLLGWHLCGKAVPLAATHTSVPHTPLMHYSRTARTTTHGSSNKKTQHITTHHNTTHTHTHTHTHNDRPRRASTRSRARSTTTRPSRSRRPATSSRSRA